MSRLRYTPECKAEMANMPGIPLKSMPGSNSVDAGSVCKATRARANPIAIPNNSI